MPVRTTPKKTVSFSDNDQPVKEGHTEIEEGITIPFSLRSIPFHYLLIVFSILKQDITTSNVLNNLVNNLYALIATQMVYTFVFVTNIVESNKKKKHNKRVKLSFSKDYNIFLSSILIAVVLVLPIYVLVVLFGAPFSTYLKENLILSAHISFLAYPIIVSYLKIGEKPIFQRFLGFIAVGAWFGAIAIPLDWDRDWQNWPLPIVVSSYIGSFIGYSIAGII